MYLYIYNKLYNIKKKKFQLIKNYYAYILIDYFLKLYLVKVKVVLYKSILILNLSFFV